MWIFLEKHFEEVLTGVLVMFMASMVFFQVIMRYVFSLPTSWSDELAIYAMLWSVYISVAWAVRERAHIRVMNFVEMFPKKVAFGLTVLVILYGFCSVFFLPIRLFFWICLFGRMSIDHQRLTLTKNGPTCV